MKILHITNDYSGSAVYKNLVSELDVLGLSQVVYHPIKENNKVGKNKVKLEVRDSEIIYSRVLNKTTDRVLYKNKIKKIVKDIETKIDMSTINMIHAHTWYSDGGAAFLLSKKYDIPYLIAVRNTDLNGHYKYFIQHRGFGRKIIRNAKKVVFIGRYQETFFLSKKSLERSLNGKGAVIPNGIDAFWIKNAKFFEKKPIGEPIKVLYIGTFIKRKRLLELQKAIIELSLDNRLKCQLHIVGGNGEQSEKILENVNRFPDLFKYHGKIDDKRKLREIYNSCFVFAMPSKQETFGLVYIEALSQGLPVLYTEKEGIDGFYDERIGEKVVSGSVGEIKRKLLKLIEEYNSYIIPTEKIIESHNWKNIALTYLRLYKL